MTTGTGMRRRRTGSTQSAASTTTGGGAPSHPPAGRLTGNSNEKYPLSMIITIIRTINRGLGALMVYQDVNDWSCLCWGVRLLMCLFSALFNVWTSLCITALLLCCFVLPLKVRWQIMNANLNMTYKKLYQIISSLKSSTDLKYHTN